MTPDEHRLLCEMKSELERQRIKLGELHDALMKVPFGSPPGTRTLLEQLRTLAATGAHLSWAARALAWLIPMVLTAGGALAAWWWRWFGGTQ